MKIHSFLEYIYLALIYRKLVRGIFFIFVFALPIYSQAQIITTIAGNGTPGSSGDGGSATIGELYYPNAVAIDNSGNLYITDDSYRIRKVNNIGIISTIAGIGTGGFSGDGGPATAAQMNPEGIVVDPSGNIYFADPSTSRIRKINSYGIITTIAGTGTSGFSGDGGPATAAELSGPNAIAIDGSGNIYICDSGTRIRKINTVGIITTIGGIGTGGYGGDGGPATTAEFNTTVGIAVDGSGNIYVADANNYRLRKINSLGIVTTFAGTGTAGHSGDGSPATAAKSNPQSVAVDALGNVYFADGLKYVRKVDTSGIITTIAGSGTIGFSGDGHIATAAQIFSPAGLAFDATRNIYFADNGNNRIRKIYRNRTPYFIGGNSQSILVCENSGADSINNLLAVIDSDQGQTETWSAFKAPVHGVLSATAFMPSTGDTVIPSGLFYTPFVGYNGNDSFKVVVTDSLASDTITIYVTVSPVSPIIGTALVCMGQTTTLSNTVVGGYWSSSGFTGIVSIGSTTGIVTGVGVGTASITYSTGSGCATTKTVTVNPSPGPITGVTSICEGITSTLTDVGGGVWNMSNTTIATVSPTGVITGLYTGTATVTYQLAGGCFTTSKITVNALPTAIIGSSDICLGNPSAFSDATTGGTWNSSNTAIATIGVSSGLLSSISLGTSTITYTTVYGCTSTATATINNAPTAIAGAGNVCRGNAIPLSDGINGGMWNSSNTAIASVGSTGLVYGASAGIATVTYSLGTGCTVTKAITVNALSPITGGTSVCVSATIPLSDSVSGGTWTSSNASVATVTASTGIVTGIALGTATIIYNLSTGCTASTTVSVSTSPTGIIGSAGVCTGSTLALSDVVGGGTWVSSNSSATVGLSTGIVSGVTTGSCTISYSLGSGCTVTKLIMIYSLPSAIIGGASICSGNTTTLSDISVGGTWSSDATSIATISSSGIVSGVMNGTANISYTMGSTGCAAGRTVTINPVPSAIIGADYVCTGAITALTDGTAGGTWNPGGGGKAMVSTMGIVTGLTAGTANITYALATGCMATVPVTVNPLPSAITGVSTVCAGATITLSDGGGGTWSSGNTSIAGIDAGTGVITGVTAGTTTITYTLGTGCVTTKAITVHLLPSAITGSSNICTGATTTLSDIGGGTWSNPGYGSIASIGLTTGIVIGISVGTATITYTLPTGCTTTTLMAVNAPPSKITGPTNVCGSLTVILSDSTAGGAWSSTNTATVSVNATTGAVTGVSAGAAIITYTTGAGCTATKTVTVNPAAPPITGVANMCAGTKMYVYDADTTYGSWTSTLVTITSGGLVNAYTTGAATITYTLPTGCFTAASLTVNPSPSVITGAAIVCTGNTTILNDTVTGGSWSVVSGGAASVGATTGIVLGISAGTAAITYNLLTGCKVTDTITIYPSPSAITGGGNVCIDATMTFSDALSGGTWSAPGGIATVGVSTGIVTGISAGTTLVTYATTGGCMAYKTVNVLPLPGVYGISGGGSFCAWDTGVHVLLSGSAGGIQYRLYAGGSVTDSLTGTGGLLDFGLQTVAGFYRATGTDTVTGCSSAMADSAVVIVNPLIAPSVIISSVPGDTICAGTSVAYTATPVNGGAGPTYQWRINGVDVGTSATTYTYIPINGDAVIVMMTSNAPCASPALTDTFVYMSVITPVTPTVMITTDPGVNIAKGQSVIFTATVTNGATLLTYQWFLNGTSLPGETNATYTSSSLVNSDYISCTVTGVPTEQGIVCSASGSGSVQMNVNSTDIGQMPWGSNVTVLPNPNKGEFLIKGSLGTANDKEMSLEITDMIGQVIYNGTVIALNGNINERIRLNSTLANGMYLLSIRSEVGNKVFHIVIEQ